MSDHGLVRHHRTRRRDQTSSSPNKHEISRDKATERLDQIVVSNRAELQRLEPLWSHATPSSRPLIAPSTTARRAALCPTDADRSPDGSDVRHARAPAPTERHNSPWQNNFSNGVGTTLHHCSKPDGTPTIRSIACDARSTNRTLDRTDNPHADFGRAHEVTSALDNWKTLSERLPARSRPSGPRHRRLRRTATGPAVAKLAVPLS